MYGISKISRLFVNATIAEICDVQHGKSQQAIIEPTLNKVISAEEIQVGWLFLGILRR